MEKSGLTITKGYQRLQRLNEQRYLYCIRAAFVSTMPILIIGAYAVVLNQLPIAAYQRFMANTFGANWQDFGTLAFNATTQIATLMVVFSICYNLADWYTAHRGVQVHGGIAGMVGLASYVAVSLQVREADSLSFTMTSVVGLFVALVVSVLSTEGFIQLCRRRQVNRMLSDDPNAAVPLAFESIFPAIVVVFGFVLLRMVVVSFGVTDGFSDIVNDMLRRPYENYGDSVGTAILYNVSSHVMWLFGIHGNNVLEDIAQTVFVPAMEANVAAVAAGAAAPNLITKTLFDTFVYMGGSGTTLALLIALVMFGSGRGYRTLLRFALPNAVFNINEPLVFGIPIVLNPIYAIPFVLTPLVMFGTTWLAMFTGLVPYTVVDVPWATPVFISGYIATQSLAGVMLQAVNLVLAVGIYAPFVRLAERMNQMRFEGAYNRLVKTVTTEYSAASRRLVHRMDEVGAVARSIANQLDGAMRDGEMFLVYQPIVDAGQCEMHSVEALLRWKHPQHGFINPMVTIALAEETGRIDALGLWIMEQAMRQRAAWTRDGLPDFHISVNVSSDQLNDRDFYRKVQRILEQAGVPGSQLQVEITETVALVENNATRDNLTALHKYGATIAMDDFGVGHSSLLYLRTMPIDTLKIDGSLSREVTKHPANLEIIATIYDLCKLMEVSTVVEYVDNDEQLEKLQSVGNFLIQGYLYSAPLPADEVPAFMDHMQALCAKTIPIE